MEPIIINTQLLFKRYYNVNLYLLTRRKMLWVMFGLAILMLLMACLTAEYDGTFMYLAIFYFAYMVLMPGLVYLRAKSLFKKIPAMTEAKRYEFTTDNIKVSSETVKMETAWSNVTKAIKRKDDFILFTAGGRSFFNLFKADFTSNEDVIAFEQLIKQQVAKNNF